MRFVQRFFVQCCLLFLCFFLCAEESKSQMLSNPLSWGEEGVRSFELWSGYSSKEAFLEKELGAAYTSIEEMVLAELKKDYGCTTKEEYMKELFGYETKSEFVKNDGDPNEWDEMEKEWDNLYKDMYEFCAYEYNEALLEWECLEYEYKEYIKKISTAKGHFAISAMDLYDVDGDKTLEWLSDNSYINIFKVNLGKQTAYQYANYNQRIYTGTWINLNNDGRIDFHGSDASIITVPDGYKELTSLTTGEENDYSHHVIFDYDNDGYPDLLNRDTRRSIYTVSDNGEFRESTVNIQTPEERAGTIEYKRNGGIISQSASVALSYNNIVSSTTPFGNLPYSYISSYNCDVNGDGIEDYIDCTNGIYIQGLGDGSGIYNDLGGSVQSFDLDGDGSMDLIGWDEESQSIFAHFIQKDGTLESKKLFSGAIGELFACRDFDRDGDVDLLLTFEYCAKLQYTNDVGGSFLVLVENMGNRKFRSHEYFYPNYLHFFYTIDFDSDGNYELLAVEDKKDDRGIIEDVHPVCYFEIEKMKINDTPIYINTDAPLTTNKNVSANIMVADFDNNGIMTLLTLDSAQWVATSLSTVANEKPKKPQSPFITFDSSTEELKINWLSTTDKESSPVDLTYALRIGTSSGACDVLYVHAHEDGTRKNMRGGNQGHSLFRVLNTQTWAVGKYYISVQAVDPNNRGSEFSDEIVFEKKMPTATFSISYPSAFGIGDTCIVTLHPNVNMSNTLSWDLDDATVINKSPDGRSMKLSFTQPGEKRISLSVTADGGLLSKTIVEKLSVQPLKTSQLFSSGYSQFALDMDEDGYMEFYDNNHSFNTYSADGSFSVINKLYNKNSYVQKIGAAAHTFDVNNDGMCDIFTRYNIFDGYGFFTIVNEGDKNMSVNTDMVKLKQTEPVFCDFNNDGWMDYIYSDIIGNEIYGLIEKNMGAYKSFENVGRAPSGGQYKDYTNDGLIDILVRTYDKTSKVYDFIVYENQGDFTFLPTDTILTSPYSGEIIEDFDNNGKPDVLYTVLNNSVNTYYIYWNDGTVQFLEEITDVDAENLFDFNNDGFIDVQVQQGKLNNEWGALMFNSDRSYQIVDFIGDGVKITTSNPYLTPTCEVALNRYKLYNVNTPPTAPTHIAAGRTSKGVTITWEHGKDNETPQMRLRYNLSVKRKEQNGEGAYLISPCNSAKDGVHVPSGKPLVDGNCFFIPTASIPAGEYEVQVQTIDLQMQESEFSDVFNLLVTESIDIEAPAATAVGQSTNITINSNIDVAINWDGGTVVSQEGNKYKVEWSSDGYKTITVGNSTQTICVHPEPILEWDLPDRVLLGSKIRVNVGEKAGNKKIYIGEKRNNLLAVAECEYADTEQLNDSIIQFTFNKEGRFYLRHTLTTSFGNFVSKWSTVDVKEEYATPEITSVTAVDGHYRVMWNVPSGFSRVYEVIGINIYKETTNINEYNLLEQITVEGDKNFENGDYSFTDSTSDPNVQSARYRLSYILANGESAKGTPHQGIHVMINRGVGKSWNLAWTKYEGYEVQTYRILRGKSAESLELVGEVSGNMNSYCDNNPEDGVLFYAVEVVISEVSEQKTRATAADVTSRSNVVSTDVAGTVAFVESIIINGGTIVAEENEYLDLLACVYPYYATYQGVNWVVINGEELAAIDRNGRLTATGRGNGEVTVRAYALDGSNVYAETVVVVEGFIETAIEETVLEQGVNVRFYQDDNQLSVSAPQGTYIAIYNLAGSVVLHDVIRDSVWQYHLTEKGVFILRIGEKAYKIICR